MISNEAVIQQLEKHLISAKNAMNEQQIREALVAIRALCDVVLDLPTATPKVQPKHVPQMLGIEQPQSNLYTARMQQDDGANGESIFDF